MDERKLGTQSLEIPCSIVLVKIISETQATLRRKFWTVIEI